MTERFGFIHRPATDGAFSVKGLPPGEYYTIRYDRGRSAGVHVD
jgi:hypothetical protein